jgi:hypothetical protein
MRTKLDSYMKLVNTIEVEQNEKQNKVDELIKQESNKDEQILELKD